MTSLILYTGPGCGLCEEAKELIYETLEHGTYDLHEVDVTTDFETKKAYGLRIPVLKNADTGEELPWPFGQPGLLMLVGESGQNIAR